MEKFITTTTPTSKGTENVSPFQKSSRVLRSPVLNVQARLNEAANEGVHPNAQIATPSPTNFGKLGEKISKLVNFLKGRNNIHKEIVSMANEIKATYMLVEHDGSNNAPQVAKKNIIE